MFYYSYDKSTVDIRTHGNVVKGNLALGMFKEMSGGEGGMGVDQGVLKCNVSIRGV